MLFSVSMLYYSLNMVYYYGFSNYDNVHFTGKFLVGHQRFYSKKFKNPVSVFYPVDKDYE